jgi:hypothetical protein
MYHDELLSFQGDESNRSPSAEQGRVASLFQLQAQEALRYMKSASFGNASVATPAYLLPLRELSGGMELSEGRMRPGLMQSEAPHPSTLARKEVFPSAATMLYNHSSRTKYPAKAGGVPADPLFDLATMPLMTICSIRKIR